MPTIVNLTGQPTTPAMRAHGVVDLPAAQLRTLHDLLRTSEVPSPDEIVQRAQAIAALTLRESLEKKDPRLLPTDALVSGPSWLTAALEDALYEEHIVPVHEVSTLTDKGQWIHLGFVVAP